MRYLGIDYGHKKIGLALSDEQGNFVYPYSVIDNNRRAVQVVSDICNKENVGEIVVGESRDFKGQPNPILEASKSFAAQLEKTTNVPVNFQNETYSSREAARTIGDDDNLDARAAAIILQSYLDLKKSKES